MSDKFQDQDFLELVVKALVDNPQDVKIERKVDEMGVLMTLDVNSADMGKVIGRQGNTAKAIRTLLRVVGMKNNARVNLKINEPAGSTHQPAALREGASTTAPRTRSASAEVDDVMSEIKG